MARAEAVRLAFVAIALTPVQAAFPQLAGSVSAVSDYRLRGLSLNGGRVAITTGVSYDHSSGAYLGASATTGDTRRFGVRFLGHTEYIGYAARLTPRLSWEIGGSNTQVYSNVLNPFSGRYREVYAGLSTEQVSARLSYSPSFFARGAGALYLDLNGAVRPAKGLRVFGHAGLLMPVGSRNPAVLPQSRYDLRFGAAAEFKRTEIQVNWTRSGADRSFLENRQQSRDALIIGASWFF